MAKPKVAVAKKKKPAPAPKPKAKPAAKPKAKPAPKPKARPATKSTAARGDSYRITIASGIPSPIERNTIGGRPVLAAGQEWPHCFCGARMILFFQLDLPDLPPFASGSHLAAFQCPDHNDAVLPPATEQLPDEYWNAPINVGGQFWRIIFNRPGLEVIAEDADPYLRAAGLEVVRIDDPVSDGAGAIGWKIGGTPSWAQSPEHYRCSCGADMVFLCQVPVNHAFATQPDQAEQPGWFSAREYAMFLGNEIYIHACAAGHHPFALWPINQN